MPMFKLRSPDKFPIDFHTAIERGFQELYHNHVDEFKTGILAPIEFRHLAQREQKRFSAFRMCLRKHPLHRLHQEHGAMDIRCEILGSPGTYYIVLKFTRKYASLSALKVALAG